MKAKIKNTIITASLLFVVVTSLYVDDSSVVWAAEEPVGSIMTGRPRTIYENMFRAELKKMVNGEDVDLFYMPKGTIVHLNRKAMVNIINYARMGGKAYTPAQMAKLKYVMLGAPVWCKVIRYRNDSSIVFVVALSPTTNTIAKFYAHCNSLQGANSVWRKLEH